MTAFGAIATAIRAHLTAASALLPADRVMINRTLPVKASGAAIVIRHLRARGDDLTLGTYTWVSDYAVECYARGPAGTNPADAIDTLLADTWGRLALFRAPALGVIDARLEPEIQWQYEEGDGVFAAATVLLSVRHRTLASQLEWNPT
jgi:hypothetical protein